MTLHCDSCDKPLGTYLYGPGGVEEKAVIIKTNVPFLPDVVCKECWAEGYTSDNKKIDKFPKPEKDSRFI